MIEMLVSVCGCVGVWVCGCVWVLCVSMSVCVCVRAVSHRRWWRE